MKRRSLLLVATGTFVPLVVAVGIAFATPSSGVTPVVHVGGARLADDVKINADRIKFQTKDPVDVSVVTLTIEPGGTTGWHSHPGFAVIAVTEGVGTLHFADCTSKTFQAGQAFVEAGDDPATVFRNESSKPLVVTVSFIAPRGAAVLRDERPPGCSVS